jgi:polyhydroxyalkanoate synthesis regulator phasin
MDSARKVRGAYRVAARLIKRGKWTPKQGRKFVEGVKKRQK